MSNYFQFTSCLLILSVAFFDEADHTTFKSQFATVLKILFTFDERCDKYGQFSELLTMIQLKNTERDNNELLEHNEQQLLDTTFNNKDFDPTAPKKVIRPKKKMDLKNRTLVNQLRDMFVLRRWINETIHFYRNDCEKITDRTAHMFRQWLAMCKQMNEMNDKVMSFDGNLISQFAMVADAALNDPEPLLNVLQT